MRAATRMVPQNERAVAWQLMADTARARVEQHFTNLEEERRARMRKAKRDQAEQQLADREAA